jgi:hypothetical protein
LDRCCPAREPEGELALDPAEALGPERSETTLLLSA